MVLGSYLYQFWDREPSGPEYYLYRRYIDNGGHLSKRCDPSWVESVTHLLCEYCHPPERVSFKFDLPNPKTPYAKWSWPLYFDDAWTVDGTLHIAFTYQHYANLNMVVRSILEEDYECRHAVLGKWPA